MSLYTQLFDKLEEVNIREKLNFDPNISSSSLTLALRIARKTGFSEKRMELVIPEYPFTICEKQLPERQHLPPISLIRIEDETFSDQSTIDYSQD